MGPGAGGYGRGLRQRDLAPKLAPNVLAPVSTGAGRSLPHSPQSLSAGLSGIERYRATSWAAPYRCLKPLDDPSATLVTAPPPPASRPLLTPFLHCLNLCRDRRPGKCPLTNCTSIATLQPCRALKMATNFGGKHRSATLHRYLHRA